MKKKYLCSICIFLLNVMCFGQTVNIPDPVFKNFLVSNVNIDQNQNGEIELGEAQHESVLTLQISGLAIQDFTGIKAFTHLGTLGISGSLATSIDVSGMEYLFTLEVVGNPNLTQLNVIETSLNSLGIHDNPVLLDLTVTGLNVSEITITGNGLQTLTVTNNPVLDTLLASNNALTSLVINNCPVFWKLDCSGNNLQQLDLSGVPSLSYELNCTNNQLTSLDMTVLPNLTELYARNNQITSLDLSQNPHLNYSDIRDNNLTTVNMKNGNDNFISVAGNPDLTFVCIDPEDEILMLEALQQLNLPNLVVNSYCNFTPGGNYNTIQGTFAFDGDGNGCDSSDMHFANSKITVTHDATSESIFTNGEGAFRFYANTGTYALAPAVDNPGFFNVSPANGNVVFTVEDGSVETRNFCVTANGVHPDAEIILNGSTPEPGFDTYYNVTLHNKGNQVLNGTASVTFDDSRLDYVESNPAATASPGALTWNFTDLQPFATRHYNFVLNLNSPMETPAVNIGDVLDFTASAVIASDETPADNTFAFSQEVFGSYDPNDITCLEGDIVSPTRIGEYLHYLVRFENTGNANAHNIVVKNMIDTSKFDVNSLQILDSSAEMATRITGNKAEFIFEGIELGAAQHGHVLYKIKTRPTLVENSSVMAFADIFFDYNFPVTTNEAETVFQQLSVGEVSDALISVYPNPTSDNVIIKANSDLKSIALFDIQGRLLMAKNVDSNAASVDLSEKQSGIYFMKVTTASGSKVEKVVKQ